MSCYPWRVGTRVAYWFFRNLYAILILFLIAMNSYLSYFGIAIILPLAFHLFLDLGNFVDYSGIS